MPIKKTSPKQAPEKKATSSAQPKRASKAPRAPRVSAAQKRLARLSFTQHHEAYSKQREKILGPPLQPRDLPGASESAPSVAEQTWDLLAAFQDPPVAYTWAFFSDGTLNHSGTVGVWRQQGAALVIETNGRYSEHQGVINGEEASGTARNIAGLKWTWTAKRRV